MQFLKFTEAVANRTTRITSSVWLCGKCGSKRARPEDVTVVKAHREPLFPISTVH